MHKKHFIIAIIVLVLINLIDINIFFHHYGKKFTDSDQLIFWLQSQDFSKGIFHNLYLYGQDYNIPFESILAAPLLYLGVPIENALIAVNLLSIFGLFVVLAYHAFKHRSEIGIFLTLITPLVLPIEWLILTSSARGFIGGVVLSVLGILFHNSFKQHWKAAIGIFIMFLGFTINPNAVVLIFPYGIFLLFKRKIYWKQVLLAIPLIAAWYLLLLNEKAAMPVVIHPSWSISWEWSAFKHSIQNFNDLFKGVLPLFYEIGALWPLYLVLVYFIAKKKKNRSIEFTAIATLLFLFISLGINKVSDGTSSIYFPYSRMFIGFPFVVLMLFIYLFKSQAAKKSTIYSLIALGILGFTLKQLYFSERIDRALHTSSGVVQVRYVPDLRAQCLQLDSMLIEKDKKLLLFHYKADELTYGCKVYANTPTLHPRYERRYWLMERYKNIKANEVLFFDWTNKIQTEIDKITFVRDTSSSEPLFFTHDTSSLQTIYKEDFTFVE